MKEFFRYLRGYLKIKVWGYSPERFMNLCSNHHILLWDIARQEDCYTMYISLSDFYKLRPIVKKARQQGSPRAKTFLFRIFRIKKGSPYRSRTAALVPVFFTIGRSL